MNKIFLVNIFSCLLLFLLMSCQDNDVAGKLRGKWQLKTVEQSGEIIQMDTVWYNFQTESLFMYQIYWADKDSFLYCEGFALWPEEYTMELELISHNPKIPTLEFLTHTDWDSNKRTFVIESITGKHLKLRSNDKSYSFTKFE